MPKVITKSKSTKSYTKKRLVKPDKKHKIAKSKAETSNKNVSKKSILNDKFKP